MKLILCKTDDDPNTINKVKYDSLEIDIVVRHDFDVVNPQLYLANDGFQVKSFNYFEIPDLNRYYFIDTISKFNDKIDLLSCTCDFLETYKDEILSSVGSYRRSPESGEYYSYGENIPVKAEIDLYYSDVTMPDDETSVVMSTIGGVEQ